MKMDHEKEKEILKVQKEVTADDNQGEKLESPVSKRRGFLHPRTSQLLASISGTSLASLLGACVQFLKNPNFLIIFISGVLDSMAISTFSTFLPPYLKHSTAGLGPVYTESLMVIGAVSVIGRFLVMLMNNKLLPRWAIFAISHLFQGCSMIGFVCLPASRPNIFACASIFGVSVGISGALLCCVCQDVFGREALSKVFSYSMFAWGIGSTCGPSVGGTYQPCFFCIRRFSMHIHRKQ